MSVFLRSRWQLVWEFLNPPQQPVLHTALGPGSQSLGSKDLKALCSRDQSPVGASLSGLGCLFQYHRLPCEEKACMCELCIHALFPPQDTALPHAQGPVILGSQSYLNTLHLTPLWSSPVYGLQCDLGLEDSLHWPHRSKCRHWSSPPCMQSLPMW